MLFHGGRLLAFTWMVGTATLTVLALRLAAINTAVAVSSVVVVALLNVFGAFLCRTSIRLIDIDNRHNGVEPLTGLLNRDGFSAKVAELIGARSRQDDRYLVVAVVNLDSYARPLSLGGAAWGGSGSHRGEPAIASDPAARRGPCPHWRRRVRNRRHLHRARSVRPH